MNLYIKYNLVTFSIHILNVEKGVVKIHKLYMSSTGEIKHCNVWVIHFKINYKIMLKAVTPV